MQKIVDKPVEQKGAEADVKSFQDDGGPFVVAVKTTRMAMVFTQAKELDNPIIFANESYLKLTGYTREEVLGQSFNFIMAHGANAEALAQIEAEFKDNSACGSEILYRRKDGSEFWAAIFISPVLDDAGTIVQYFASFVDLTKHREDEAQSRMLIDELHHRVKNTLATVQSVVWQALRTASDPKMIRETIESRLFALSRSHDLLARENWKSAGLLDVVTNALEPFGVADGRAERMVIMGDNIRFLPQPALALAVAFNELATNAVKYGAFANETGSILVEWKVETKPEGRRLALFWREKNGPPVIPPSHTGFGSRVIERGLVHELGGTVHIDYPQTGVICSMSFPAPADLRDG